MKPKVLLQLDTDASASSFDALAAIDSGVEHLLQYGAVTAETAVKLVHGAMFTRGPDDLASTAIFIGGSDLRAGEAVLEAVNRTLFDPLRVSVVLDSSGSNSTAAAAVLSAAKHVDLQGCNAVVMGASGAVGSRVCHLLAIRGANVAAGSREKNRAVAAAADINSRLPNSASEVTTFDYSEASITAPLAAAELLIACGAAGVQLLSAEQLASASALKVAIDLNAVAPQGVPGISVGDKGTERDGRRDYGALGVGGLKMKIHKAVIREAFQTRGKVFDAAEFLSIGEQI